MDLRPSLITSQGDASTTDSAAVWTALGAAGIIGALGDDAVQRVGLTTSWVVLMLTMSAATLLFAAAPPSTPATLVAATSSGPPTSD